MTPILKLYLKTFLIAGIPFALIMFGLYLADDSGFRIWRFLFMIFFFGLTMSITLVFFHRYRLGKIGIREISADNLKVSQTKSLKSKLTINELTKRLKADPIFGKKRLIKLENGILLKTGTTWKSWGEDIKIILRSDNNSEFDYEVSSSPSLKTTLIDYGKNLENITRVERIIN